MTEPDLDTEARARERALASIEKQSIALAVVGLVFIGTAIAMFIWTWLH